ncbi:MAG: hypothetical protein ACC608_02270 [Anaerofustis sp.]
MNILIMGGAQFVSSRLAEFLIGKGLRCACLREAVCRFLFLQGTPRHSFSILMIL